MNTIVRAAVVALFAVALCGGLASALASTSSPLMGTALPLVASALALGINWFAFVPAAIMKSERFYDLTGSVTFLSVVTAAVLAAPSWRAPGRLVPALLVATWAIRLGTFLFARIHRVGEDRRFAEMRERPARFFVAWTLQGVWVFVSIAPVLVLVASRAHGDELTLAEPIGWLIWLVGFSIEVIADRQKQRFAASGAGRFITTGLWAWSRHPNYFGEILLWVGLFTSGVQRYQGAEWLTVASPILVLVLLRFVSGVPLLEARADEKFGEDPAYRDYRQRTPLLIPRPPR